jgi:hypothetical protein
MDPIQEMAQRYGYPQQYQDYSTQYQGAKEVIGWTWWDVNNYTTAATNQLSFFATVKATRNLSNMKLAGQLPMPSAFFLRAIRVQIYDLPYDEALVAAPATQTGQLNDHLRLLNNGVGQLYIGDKLYGEWPLWMLPAGGGVVTKIGIVAASVLDSNNNGFQDPRAVYSLTKPLFIAPQINFRFDMIWPAGAETLISISPKPIWCGLDGDLIRPVQ